MAGCGQAGGAGGGSRAGGQAVAEGVASDAPGVSDGGGHGVPGKRGRGGTFVRFPRQRLRKAGFHW